MIASTREIKKTARSALTGRWIQPIWLIITAYLLTQVVGMLLNGLFNSTTLMYVILLMLLNYFVLFAFQYGQFYFPLSVFRKQPFKFSMLFVAFSPYYYKRFVILNFIKTIFLSIASVLLFIPFIGKMSWGMLLNFIFGNYSVDLVNQLVKVMTALSTMGWVFFFILLAIFLLISLFVSGFFQIASYLVFENTKNPNAHILISTLFLMKNHWLALLKLQLSFVIWYIFYPVTFLWLIPYRQMAIFIFYLNLKNEFASKMSQFTKQFKDAGAAYKAHLDQQEADNKDSDDSDTDDKV